jgi:AraC-like DNA-binding protein
LLKGGDFLKLTKNQVKALKRIKGENDLTIIAMSQDIGISRFTLNRIFKSNSVSKKTIDKVNDFIVSNFLKG